MITSWNKNVPCVCQGGLLLEEEVVEGPQASYETVLTDLAPGVSKVALPNTK